MSQIIVPEVSKLTISPANGPEGYDFHARVPTLAQRKLGSVKTTASLELNRNKLVSALCADFRSHFTSIFEKRDEAGRIIPASMRLPDEYYQKAVEAVDAFIKKQFDSFLSNADQLGTYNVRFVHKVAQKDILLRHTIRRDEIIAIKERIVGINAFISDTERLLDKYNKQQSTWSEITADRVAKLEKRLVNERNTLAHLQEEMAKQKTA